jgi:hypothetical protein
MRRPWFIRPKLNAIFHEFLLNLDRKEFSASVSLYTLYWEGDFFQHRLKMTGYIETENEFLRELESILNDDRSFPQANKKDTAINARLLMIAMRGIAHDWMVINDSTDALQMFEELYRFLSNHSQ